MTHFRLNQFYWTLRFNESNNESMVLCAKRVVPDILAAKCSTWVLVEEFWTKLTSYDVIHNITVFDLKQRYKTGNVMALIKLGE